MSSGRRSRVLVKSKIPEPDAESSISTLVPKKAEAPKKGRKGQQKTETTADVGIIEQNLPQSTTEMRNLRSARPVTQENIRTSLVVPNPQGEPGVEQREKVGMPQSSKEGSKSKNRVQSTRNNNNATTSKSRIEQSKADADSQKASQQISKHHDAEMAHQLEFSLPHPVTSKSTEGRKMEGNSKPKSSKIISQSISEEPTAKINTQELTQKNVNSMQNQYIFKQAPASKYGIVGIHEEPINDSVSHQTRRTSFFRTPVDPEGDSEEEGEASDCPGTSGFDPINPQRNKSAVEESSTDEDQQEVTSNLSDFNRQKVSSNNPKAGTQRTRPFDSYRAEQEKSIAEDASPHGRNFTDLPTNPQPNLTQDQDSSRRSVFGSNSSEPQRNLQQNQDSNSRSMFGFNSSQTQRNLTQNHDSNGRSAFAFNKSQTQRNLTQNQDSSGRSAFGFNSSQTQSNLQQNQDSNRQTVFGNQSQPQRNLSQDQDSNSQTVFGNQSLPQRNLPQYQDSTGQIFVGFNRIPFQRNIPQSQDSNSRGFCFRSFNSISPQQKMPQDQDPNGQTLVGSNPVQSRPRQSSSEEDEEHEEALADISARTKAKIREEWVCKMCFELFARKEDLRRHMVAKHGKKDKRENVSQDPKEPLLFTCPFCPDKFRRTVDSNAHIIKHHKTTIDSPFYCTVCGQGFISEELHDVHFSSAHPDEAEEDVEKIPEPTHEPMYKCPVCPVTFRRKAYSNTHVLEFHKVEVGTPTYCKVCGHGFLYEALLQLHYKTVHPDKAHEEDKGGAPNPDLHDDSSISLPEEEPSLVMLDTSSSSNQSDDLPNPKRVKQRGAARVADTNSSPKTPRKQPVPKTNSNSGQRDGNFWKVGKTEFPIVEYDGPKKDDKYLYVASPAPVSKEFVQTFKQPRRKCSICFKSLSIAYYKTHKTKHTRPFQTVTCPECLKQYGNKQLLKQHVERVHEFKLNFTCQVCTKGFYARGEQQRHISVNHDLVRFVCMGCRKAYNYKDGLQAHNRSIHSPDVRNTKEQAFSFSHQEKDKSGPIPLDKPEGAATSRPAITLPRANTRKTIARFVVSPRKSFPVHAKPAPRKIPNKPVNNAPVPENQEQSNFPIQRSGRASKLPVRFQADTSGNTTVLEKTLNKSYAGLRKRCSNCGKDYAASYVSRHKLRAHGGLENGPNQQTTSKPIEEEPRNANAANNDLTMTSKPSTSAQSTRTRSSRKTFQ